VSLPPTRRDTVRRSLGLASVGAGAIHLALGPEHLGGWVVLGTGLLVSGVLQVLWGVALVRRESRRLLALGAVGSLLPIGVWLVTRTTGSPFGPQAWHVESVGRADLTCVALESVVALGALTLLRRPTGGLAPAGRVAVRGALSGVALAVLVTTGVAVAAPGHGHGGAPCPSSPVYAGVDENGNGADDGVEDYFRCALREAHEGHTGYAPPKL
jgi:hypothetical protein